MFRSLPFNLAPSSHKKKVASDCTRNPKHKQTPVPVSTVSYRTHTNIIRHTEIVRTHPQRRSPGEGETPEQYEDEGRHRRDRPRRQYGLDGAKAETEAEEDAEALAGGKATVGEWEASENVFLVRERERGGGNRTFDLRHPDSGPFHLAASSTLTAPWNTSVHLATADARRTARRRHRSTAVVPSNESFGDTAIIDRVRGGLRF